MFNKCNAVFEGGGVKGIGLVGAVSALEAKKYEFANLAGTSAGAIVAALLAAGYNATELEQILRVMDYEKFKDGNLIDHLGLPGKVMSEFLHYGMYNGEYFKDWMENLLYEKKKLRFGDILADNPGNDRLRYKFQAIATDLTDHRMLVLPWDLKDFGYDPDEYSIAMAVRMSMSIPLFFEPVKLTDNYGKTHYIVDGGVLSNYPVWLLDDGSPNPIYPTFGLKLVETDRKDVMGRSASEEIKNLPGFLESIVSTLLEGHDNYYISTTSGDFDRTICISTTVEAGGEKKKIKTTDFEITEEENKALFMNGKNAAEKFLESFNFDVWKNTYRCSS
ncbi:MAG: patatin-like phospholipase family protein [Methanobacterium sp.]